MNIPKLIGATLLLAVSLSGGNSMASDTLKKISLTKTNNTIEEVSSSAWLIPHFDKAALDSLKKLISQHGYNSDGKNELETVLYSLKWVSEQWDHDGINNPPEGSNAEFILKKVYEEKQKYRCVEYGAVLTEVLQARGFISRKVGLVSTDVAYGVGGQGHVATEVWIDDLNKWIFLDPQFGAYFSAGKSSEPLSFYEIYLLNRNKKWSEVKVNFVVGADRTGEVKKAATEYKKFVRNYFGGINTSTGKDKPSLQLMLELKEMFMTFQGMNMQSRMFIKDYKQFYPEMNRVTLFLQYREKSIPFSDLVKKYNIDVYNEKSYRKAMPLFAAKPEYFVDVSSKMPLLTGYEYRLDKKGDWTFSKDSRFSWDATKSVNYLEVRGVNEAGYKSPVTFMEIKYQ